MSRQALSPYSDEDRDRPSRVSDRSTYWPLRVDSRPRTIDSIDEGNPPSDIRGSIRVGSEDMNMDSVPEPTPFVDSHTFQSLVGIVILLNVLVMWGEADNPDWQAWVVLDNLFLLIFILEIYLRMREHGCKGYYHGRHGQAVDYWHLLDTIIVATGMLDLWITPCLGALMATHTTSFLRFLRLLRMLRLLRLFDLVPAFGTFISALKDMMETFTWIFIVFAIFLFTFGVSLAHLLGHGEALNLTKASEKAHAEDLATIAQNFGSVPDAVFTLFKLTTIDNWDDIAFPVIAFNPWWRLFFLCFIAFGSWTMISVLTAVASNKMIAATADRKENESKEQEKKYQAFIAFLSESFRAADEDGNGMLDMGEFSALISQEFVHQRMRELGVHMSQEELFKAWEMLDIDESGELTIEEFVTGLSTLQEGLATKHMVSIDYNLKRVALKTEIGLENATEKLEVLMRENEQLIDQVNDREEEPDLDEALFVIWKDLQDSAGNTASTTYMDDLNSM